MLKILLRLAISIGLSFGLIFFIVKGLDVYVSKEVGWPTIVVTSILLFLLSKKSAKGYYAEALEFKKDLKSIKEKVEDDYINFMAEAETEITSNIYDRNLWSKALVDAEGNEQKRKAIYISLRAKQLARRNHPS